MTMRVSRRGTGYEVERRSMMLRESEPKEGGGYARSGWRKGFA